MLPDDESADSTEPGNTVQEPVALPPASVFPLSATTTQVTFTSPFSLLDFSDYSTNSFFVQVPGTTMLTLDLQGSVWSSGELTFNNPSATQLDLLFSGGTFQGDLDTLGLGAATISLSQVSSSTIDDLSLVIGASQNVTLDASTNGAAFGLVFLSNNGFLSTDATTDILIRMEELDGGGGIDLGSMNLILERLAGNGTVFRTSDTDLLEDVSIDVFLAGSLGRLQVVGMPAFESLRDSAGLMTGNSGLQSPTMVNIRSVDFDGTSTYVNFDNQGAVQEANTNFTVSSGGSGTVYFGAGNDVVTISGGAIAANYNGQFLHGGAGSDTLVLSNVMIDAELSALSFDVLNLSGTTSGTIDASVLDAVAAGPGSLVITGLAGYTAGSVSVALGPQQATALVSPGGIAGNYAVYDVQGTMVYVDATV